MSSSELQAHLLQRLQQVQTHLGVKPLAQTTDVRFADVLDSMGMVEFLAILVEDLGVALEDIEKATGRRFGTVAELADTLAAYGYHLPLSLPITEKTVGVGLPRTTSTSPTQGVWLLGTDVSLPARCQPTRLVDPLLGKPAGWLEQHAGIVSRHLWEAEDPLGVTADTAQRSLERSGLSPADVRVLLVTSQTPPQPVGLAPALHSRLGLQDAISLEVGGACTGWLSALWLGQQLLGRQGVVLLVSVEAPSRWLTIEPGAAGETAALFGDACATSVLAATPGGATFWQVAAVQLGIKEGGEHLLHFSPGPGGVRVEMDGTTLASRAVRLLTQRIQELTSQQGLKLTDLGAIVIHGGNGRLPGLLARQLGLASECIWSETAWTGNLGSASIPVAWASQSPPVGRPVVWAAIGAGLTWGTALLVEARV